MGLYEENLHGFLSSPENFDYAWEIYEAVPVLREKLKTEALDEFEKMAAPLAQANGWVCWRIEPEKVGVSKPAWNRMFAVDLYIGKQYYQSVGLWHDKTHAKLSAIYDELARRTKEQAKAVKAKDSGSSDLWYVRLGTNFETGAEMRELLPSNRPSLVQGYWNRLWSLAEAFAPAVDEMVRDLTTHDK